MPTNLYGPGDNYHPDNSHVLPALIRRFHEAKDSGAKSVTCWGTGSPLREFLHVDDLGVASVFALERWSATRSDAPKDDHGNPLPFLNVGTGVDLTIKDLAERVSEAVGYQGVIDWDTTKPDGTPKKQLDAAGWRLWAGLLGSSAEGLADTVALFQKQLRQNQTNQLFQPGAER